MKLRPALGSGSAGLVPLLGIAAALAGLASRTGAWSPPAWLPRAAFALALVVSLLLVAAFAHALRRRDLARPERLGLAVGHPSRARRRRRVLGPWGRTARAASRAAWLPCSTRSPSRARREARPRRRLFAPSPGFPGVPSDAVALADRPVFLYVESDGMVCLVRREGVLTFPREGDAEVPPELEFRGEMDFPEGKVLFAVPRLHAWPREWTFKDEVPARSDVAVVVHRAINASLVREVVGGLVFHPDGERVLLVKASRGFTKGMWNIPGGFVTYAEAPEQSMHRELEEETGLTIRLTKLLGVFTQKFGSPYYMRGHMYLAEALSTDLRLQEDEIAEAAWFTLDDVRRLVTNPFARRSLDALEKGKGLTLD